MKTRYLIPAFVLMFSLHSCATWRNTLSPHGDINTMVSNCITDFCRTSKLFRKYNIFDLHIREEENIYIVSLGYATNLVYPGFRDTLGAKNNWFPTQYTIRDGKLFYWNDPEQPITKRMIDILLQYNAIDLEWRDREYNIPLNISDGESGYSLYIPPTVIDDGANGVVYYICKNDFTYYKKTGFDRFFRCLFFTIFRHYKRPKMKCCN